MGQQADDGFHGTPPGVVRKAQEVWASHPAEVRREQLDFIERAEPTVDPATMPAWEAQAAHYPVSGPPGISYTAPMHPAGVPVNCLLHRDDDGELDGIYNHYPQGVPGLEQPNSANMWVRPDRQGRGIGTQLLMARLAYDWPYDLDAVRMTPAGLAMSRSLIPLFAPLPGDRDAAGVDDAPAGGDPPTAGDPGGAPAG